MDVDHLAEQPRRQLVRQHLHVAGEHDQFGLSVFHQLQHPRLGLGLLVLVHRDVVERNILVHDLLLIVEMVRDHARDLDRQGADTLSIEQVIQAMPEARDHDHDLHAI